MRIDELLGPECSSIGFRPLGSSTSAYVLFRGLVVAALGADPTAAEAALRAKVERFLPALREAKEVPAVEDVNLVLLEQDRSPLRMYVRPLAVERALLELDLGVAGALTFRDPGSGNFAVISRALDGTPQLLRIGTPVLGDDDPARALPIPGRTPPPAEEPQLLAGKAARVRPLLRCPGCLGKLDDVAGGLACAKCARTFPRENGKPVLALQAGYEASPRGKSESQNTYGQQVLELIETHRDGWVLDLGSGSPTLGFYNVVHLDLAAYPQVDVVTDGGPLPFAADTFDAILSEAVLEHVRDPDAYMAELVRVLKPGGRVRLDAAFLQPYHGFPDHYFNMTKSGLRLTVEKAGLEVLGLEAGEHQQPWLVLGLVLGGIVWGTRDPVLQERLLKTTFREALDDLGKGKSDLYRGLGRAEVDRLAAGFWCLAQKPQKPAS